MVAEIGYDRALIKLCESNDITVMATSFAFPKKERARLERELAGAGIDLAALDRPLARVLGRRCPRLAGLELGGVDGGLGAGVHLSLAKRPVM